MSHNTTYIESSFRYANLYLNVFYLSFGNIGNLFKVAFFLQRPLRSVPCTTYILIATVCDVLTLNNLPILQLLNSLYPQCYWMKISIDWSNQQNQTLMFWKSISMFDLGICKICSYLHMFSTNLSFTMLLFASINRYLAISYRRRQHQIRSNSIISYLCNRSLVSGLNCLTIIFFAIVSTQHLINFIINSPYEGCVPSNRIFWVTWLVSYQCLILPILMIIFGYLTLKKIRFSRPYRQSIEIRSYSDRNSVKNQIERQLTLMIIGETIVTILTSLPYGIYALYHLLQTFRIHSFIIPNQSLWIPLAIRLTMYFEPCCGFYMYLLTLTVMRKRFSRMIINHFTKTINFIRRH